MGSGGFILTLVVLIVSGLVLWFVNWRRERGRLVRADTQLELALWASAEELWELDVRSDLLHRRGRISGLHLSYYDTPAPNLQTFLNIVHRDDRLAVAANFERVISGTAEHADVAYRVRSDKHSWIWLQSRGRAMSRDAQGRAHTVVGTSRNITQLKEREQRLHFALIGAGEELWEVDTLTGTLRRENAFEHLLPVDGEITSTLQRMNELVHPEDVEAVGRRFGAALAGTTPSFHATYRFRTPDGSYMWLDTQGQGIEFNKEGKPRRVLGTTRDISAIKYGEERLRLALWGSRAELWDVDMASGQIHRDERLPQLPLQQEHLLFRELLDAVHADDRASLRDAMIDHAKRTTDAFEAQFRMADASDNWRWFVARGRVTERDANGHAQRMLGTLHDITALKGAEDELRRLNEELEARVSQRTADLSTMVDELRMANAQLREAQRQLVEAEKMASLGSLVAGVAHEINTPLGISVTAASQMDSVFADVARSLPAADGAQVRATLEKGQRCAKLVLSNLERASRLVSSFKQVAVDQASEAVRRINVAQYLDEILASLLPRLKRTKHRVQVECAPNIDVETYPGALYQIVVNLIMNSLLHAFADDASGTINITAQLRDKTLDLQYRDDGSGMSQEIRARIFEPFFTTRRGSGGTGLGMHVVYNLVTQLLHGTIACRSAPGEGCTFDISFPVSLTPRPTAERAMLGPMAVSNGK
jgi:signal transduction histidine kinase